MKDSGKIFYIDQYNVQYFVEWTTIGESLDITTITKQPRIWGRDEVGRVQNKVAYRTGLVTVVRQILKRDGNDYIIVAEGSESRIEEFNTTFQCSTPPSDPFKYHYDNYVTDRCDLIVTDGPRWTDPTTEPDTDVLWSTGFEWIDVWSS